MHRHGRFAVAFALGLVVVLLVPAPLSGRFLAGADLFFATYLALTAWHARTLTPQQLRRNVGEDDEGGTLILLLAIGIVVASVLAVVGMLTGAVGAMPFGPELAVAAVPLGWATLHTVMAFRYADLYHDGSGAPPLDFPGGDGVPALWDFLYFSFTLGMTAQTSDTAIRTTRLRRVVALHSALSFFYNTVILALAVNAVVSLGR